MADDDEEELLRSVALQNAHSIVLARRRAESELRQAKSALEHKSNELAQSLAMMRATLESTTDGILVTDREGHTTGFNRKLLEMWDVPQELIRSTVRPQSHDAIRLQLSDPQQFTERIEQIYASSGQEFFDVLELSDGRVFERFSSVHFVEHRNVGRVWSFRDITEQRRAEKALRDESDILELLNETGTAIASVLDLQTLLQTVTDAATQLSGARLGTFFYAGDDGTLLLHAVSGAPRESGGREWQPHLVLEPGPLFPGDSPVRSPDLARDRRRQQPFPLAGLEQGQVLRSYLAVPVLSRSAELIGAILLGHPDIDVFNARAERIIVGVAAQTAVAIDNARLYAAAQRAAEERKQLLARERLARSDAERLSDLRDEFLATLSHELRTPLSAILGWSQILRRGSRTEADLQRGLDTIERNARIQVQLIEDLLDMSRITAGKMVLDMQALDPLGFIEAALESVRPAAEARDITLHRDFQPIAAPIQGDVNRLQQVVWNLLTNALKFTPPGGTVTVSLRQNDSGIEIAVRDTGMGISPDFLPHVFERFRQADGTRTRRHGGLGLGLSIVSNLVEMHGGSVQAHSAGENQGACFIVRLPLAGNTAPPEAAVATSDGGEAASLRPLPGIKILLVDDEADARLMLERMLADCQAEILSTASPLEALQLIDQERPDVLLSDIGMPGIDGFELLRQIRALGDERGGTLPAIALTAFARSDDRARALRAGFLAHLAKPVEAGELTALIASVTGCLGPPRTRLP